ncbi:hypothetical protein UWK_03464 [Desulfocapsa sulfexigens DSM 10523]|uniref:Uncharacterized protein n=1 Tax=Desulfocapsa sulfexigens (strain DSM 10523 / SB164P1) TaxID=1167006 RepID=M1PKF5_DESSD|nr:hypothetical protein [Desulfocapsa sulfexigens]AGF79980.1 hypothetical protein UWK_03464 [Desulfocapsa sulfexigens DSM 10523]
MDKDTSSKNSRLIPILREGVAVIQMIFFKEIKSVVLRKHPDLDSSAQNMFAGAITNEIFGTHNTEEKFQLFRNSHQGLIEQELMSLNSELPHMTAPLSDALRIQTLCDNQEGIDSAHVLQQANSIGMLVADREIPLPSSFMETVRTLGATHNLIIPPVEIDTTEEHNLLQ